MDITEVFIAGLAIVGFGMIVFGLNAAYYNGVNDGYGAARERGNPGYKKAYEWLVANRAYQWPELRTPVEPTSED